MGGETTLIWDWNGTLLNDVNIAIDAMNVLLQRYRLPILSLRRYREIFQFPVENYYIYAGFNFESTPFAQLASEFLQEYYKRLPSAPLFEEAKKLLSQFQARNYKQFVLSAMEHSALEESLADKGVLKYFDGVYGISDIFAQSKSAQAQSLMHEAQILPEDTIIIGDTLHDYQIALELNCSHILISQGHQAEEKLRAVSMNVLNHLHSLPSYLFRYFPKRNMSRFTTAIPIDQFH